MAVASSVTRTGRNEPFELQLARGQISYHKSIFKFGFNPDVDDSLETVWPKRRLQQTNDYHVWLS